TPGSDDLELRGERFISQLETNLVVAFARTAVCNPISAFGESDLDLTSCEQWPGDRRTEEIRSLVTRSGLHQRPEKICDEFGTQILNIDFGCSRSERLFLDPLQFVVLANIPSHRDDFASVVLFEPRNDDGRVQSARICQYNFFDMRIHDLRSKNVLKSFHFR